MLLYDYPEYYEVAFSFRDVASEARFLHEVAGRFSDIPVKRMLEIGSGHGPHVGELSRLGYEYCGLDNNQNMIDYGIEKWKHLDNPPEFIHGDMARFSCQRKVDFAFVMLGSLYLRSPSQLQTHFDSIASVLKRGGLYFLDWCVEFSDPLHHNQNNAFAIRQGGISLESRFDISLIDSERQMYREVWTVDVNDHGQQRTFEVTEQNMAVLPERFLELIEARDDIAFVGWWEDWDLKQPISDYSTPRRPIILLRRR